MTGVPDDVVKVLVHLQQGSLRLRAGRLAPVRLRQGHRLARRREVPAFVRDLHRRRSTADTRRLPEPASQLSANANGVLRQNAAQVACGRSSQRFVALREHGGTHDRGAGNGVVSDSNEHCRNAHGRGQQILHALHRGREHARLSPHLLLELNGVALLQRVQLLRL